LIANGKIFAGLLEHLLLTGLPAIAAVLLAARCRVRSLPLLLAIGIGASGAVAALAFWAYYTDPTVGQAWGFFVLFGSAGLCIWLAWERQLDLELLRPLRTPLALWVLGSFFVVFLGFLHGIGESAINMSATRFTPPLPSDNDIPRFYAEWFASHGHIGDPPIYPPDWLMSDRPPLQVGYVLSQRPVGNDLGALHYELLSAVVQALWIPAMWAVLVAARLRPVTRSLTMAAVMVSDIAIIYGFFVWPKLIAAAFLLAALALVISPEWTRWRRQPWIAVLLGALLAFAMLAHGSSIFGVIPLIGIAVLRGLPNPRWVVVLCLAGLVAYAPWVAYQHYADPPGNRLVKWQLGGETQVDERGALDAIEAGYGRAGLGGALEYKLDNFGEMIGVDTVGAEANPAERVLVGAKGWADGFDALFEGRFEGALEGWRGPRFFSLLPMLGILLLAPFAMWFGRARGRLQAADWRFSLLAFAFAGIGCLVWGLLLFGNVPARATVHVGSLVVPLLAISACIAGLRATYPRLAAWIVAINVAIVLVTYAPALTPPPGSGYSPIAALLVALSLGAIGWVLARPGIADSPPD
jgi:hypothetical protein